jgi:hypothetical protein
MGSFQRKMDACSKNWANEEPLHEPDSTWDGLLAMLFPEVAGDLGRDPGGVARTVLEQKSSATPSRPLRS